MDAVTLYFVHIVQMQPLHYMFKYTFYSFSYIVEKRSFGLKIFSFQLEESDKYWYGMLISFHITCMYRVLHIKSCLELDSYCNHFIQYVEYC